MYKEKSDMQTGGTQTVYKSVMGRQLAASPRQEDLTSKGEEKGGERETSF